MFLKKFNFKKNKNTADRKKIKIKIWFVTKKYNILLQKTNTFVNINVTIGNYFNHIKFEIIKLLGTDFLDEINTSSIGK